MNEWMNAIFYRYVKTFIIRWSVWWSVRNFYRYDDRCDDRYETFIGMMFWSYKNFYRYDWSVRWWSSWSVRNFYRYGTFIGMKLLSVQKLLSVRNFYQYETFIDGTFIGTKLLNFFLSVQWLLNFYRYNGLWMNEWMDEWMNESVQWL